MEIPEKLLKPYDAKETEGKIYKIWEDSGFFNPDVCVEKGIISADAEAFSIVLPPPNATGVLHLGHALEDSMQDTMIRYNRMLGKKTLWLPGTDHAAIATDSKVTKILEKEGLRKKEIGREKFLERVDEFVADSRKTIVSQLRKMGASLDWSREAFTLDSARSVAVNTAFKKMYDDGLIYQGYKIINWDPKGQTVISDDEVVHVPRKATLYTFKYSKDFPIAISTTRLETKVGDVAVAVHPNDERYKDFVGKEYHIDDFVGEKLKIKIVADEAVDPEFGTGALGVTPGHSIIDHEIATRHNLGFKTVINYYAKMAVESPLLKDKKTEEAREIVANWLQERNLVINSEEIDQNISTAERTGGIIEPLFKLQWFVLVNKEIPSRRNKTLKELMLEPIKNEDINILPENFEKVYYNWVENLRDWCISRQIWYGHRIPVWYCTKNEKVDLCAKPIVENVNSCPGCGGTVIQDEDSLDTWFSSGLWSFSTLGWPKANAQDLKTFHPTNVINPGYEILFFWVARMILMSQYLLGEIPFKTIYLHGMLRDAKGQKFSKSLGNGVDPIEVIAEHGADALRMSLIVGIAPGMDSKFDIQKVKAYSKFSNKIWNATRFVLEQTKDFDVKNIENLKLDEEDQKSQNELETLMGEITLEMNEYKFYIVAEKLYHYFWHTFADIIIERSKKKILENSNTESAKAILVIQLEKLIRALHPFMPFITEEIWEIMGKKKLLMVEKWPSNKND